MYIYLISTSKLYLAKIICIENAITRNLLNLKSKLNL